METWDSDGRADPSANPASRLLTVFGVATSSLRQNLDPLRADQVLVEYRPSVDGLAIVQSGDMYVGLEATDIDQHIGGVSIDISDAFSTPDHVLFIWILFPWGH